jgi:general stress protein 26
MGNFVPGVTAALLVLAVGVNADEPRSLNYHAHLTNGTEGPRSEAAWQRAGGVLAAALLATAFQASGEKGNAGRRAALISAARAVMRASPRVALITVDAEGRAQARTMDVAPPSEEMVVWLATNPRSRKVDEIRRNPSVTLYYFDPEAPGYVSLLGRARLVDTPEARERHWHKAWDAFYASRSEALLIEVVAEQLEVVNIARSIEGDPATWQPPTVRFDTRPASSPVR